MSGIRVDLFCSQLIANAIFRVFFFSWLCQFGCNEFLKLRSLCGISTIQPVDKAAVIVFAHDAGSSRSKRSKRSSRLRIGR